MINRSNFLLVNKYWNTRKGTVAISTLERYKFYSRHILFWADEDLLCEPSKIKNGSLPSYLSTLETDRGPISPESIKKILECARAIYEWAREENQREFRQIKKNYINSLKPLKNDRVFASEVRSVSEDEMFELLDCFKKSGLQDDPVLRRDMAAEVFLYLSGQRAGAFVTSPIAAINITDDEIYQWPDVYHVKTKNGKKATTALFQVPGLIDFVKEYDNWVRQVIPQEMWNEYPWYVGFKNNWGDVSLCLSPLGEKRGNELIKRFKNLANRMKKEYENPHAFRHGHAVYGISHARTPAEYQAVSRNLMHDSIVITDKIYATLEFEDRKKVIEKMHTFAINQPDENLFKILKPMSKEDLVRVIHLAADLMAR